MPNVRNAIVWIAFLFAVTPTPGAAPPTLTGRDRYGDPLPKGAVMRLGTVRFRHGLGVGSGYARLQFSPDGQTLISVGDVGMKIWDAKSGKEIPWPATGRVEAARLTADGKTLVLAVCEPEQLGSKQTGSIQHWNFRSQKLLRKTAIVWESSFRGVFAFSDNGRALMRYGGGQTSVWGDKGGKPFELAAELNHGHPISISADGRLLALCTRQGKLTIYDVGIGQKLHEIRSDEAQNGFFSPRFSPDGRHVIAYGEGRLHLCDVKTGKLLHRRDGLHGDFNYSPNGKQFACFERGTVHVLDPSTLKTLRTFATPGASWVFAVAFSADGKRLAFGDYYSTSIWDVATGKNLSDFVGHRSTVRSLCFSSDGERLASGGDDGAACVWDRLTGKMLSRFDGHYLSVPGVAFSRDGSTLATGDGQPTYGTDSREAEIRLFDLERGKLIRRFAGHLNSVNALRFSPDGKRLATSGNDFRVRLWDLATARRLWQVRHAFWQPIAFLDGGKTLMIHDNEGRYALHDAATGARRGDPPAGRRNPQTGSLLDWPVESGYTGEKEFSHDGLTRARQNESGQLELLDRGTARPFAVLQLASTALAFSPDGRWLATGGDDTCVLIWDLEPLRVEHICNELFAGRPDKRATRHAAGVTAEISRRLHRLAEAEARVLPYLRALDDEEFAARERASRALERMGESARAALELARQNSPSLEVRNRAGRLLDRLAGKSEFTLAQLKQAMAVLADLSEASRRLLGELSRGDKDSVVAQAARQALETKGDRR